LFKKPGEWAGSYRVKLRGGEGRSEGSAVGYAPAEAGGAGRGVLSEAGNGAFSRWKGRLRKRFFGM
jgi:hypothetical protein